MGRFSKKKQNVSQNLNVLRLQAAITTQWLQISVNSLSSDPCTGCLVSISPLEPIQNHSPGLYAPYKKPTYRNFRQRLMSDIR